MNFVKYCKNYKLQGILEGREGFILTVLIKHGVCIFAVIIDKVPSKCREVWREV
jgi:hypothetical protein